MNPSPRGRLNATDCMFENNQADFPEPEAEYDPATQELEGGGAVMLEDTANATFVACNFTLNGGAVRDGAGAVAAGFLVLAESLHLVFV